MAKCSLCDGTGRVVPHAPRRRRKKWARKLVGLRRQLDRLRGNTRLGPAARARLYEPYARLVALLHGVLCWRCQGYGDPADLARVVSDDGPADD